MTLGRDIRRALTMSPREVVARVARRARGRRADAAARARDLTAPTWASSAPGGSLARILEVPSSFRTPAHLEQLAVHALAHRFDLLGSGWVRVVHGMTCRGVEGHVYGPGEPVTTDGQGRWLEGRIDAHNLPEAQRIWALVSAGYVPIDWQLDFKSGHRWDDQSWYRDIAYGTIPGVDVKVPWELARMQHLPQLALVAVAAGTDPERSSQCAREVVDEILDFIACNPPRRGVNWACAMDVGIRVANMLVAVDILRAGGIEPDAAFGLVFTRSVFEHADHIAKNLEGTPEFRSNHYLADIVGLLFASVYLPDSSQSREWLTFATAELVTAIDEQFGTDGGNFEGSSSYHRLSAEMAVWGVAILRGRVPGACIGRLVRAGELSRTLTTPCGEIAQFGDTDNGRFLKLEPVHTPMTVAEAKRRFANLDGYDGLPDDAEYLAENHLDHRHLVSACGALGGRADLVAAQGSVEPAMIAALVSPARAAVSSAGRAPLPGGGLAPWLARAIDASGAVQSEWVAPPGLRDGLIVDTFPEFGVHVFRSDRLYLAVRCGAPGQRGNAGHDHNDQLAIELWVDGEPLVRDPGTYLYTPLPKRRDAYRSVAAHHAPVVPGSEPGTLELGLFQIVSPAVGRVEYVGTDGFVGSHNGYPRPVYRLIEIASDGVRIIDWSDALHLAKPEPRLPYSPGYGIIEREVSR